MLNKKIKITESPRDAMQGLKQIIPLEQKIKYINSLLKVGFYSVDIGSFVSARAVPQMADTAKVLENIDVSGGKSKISVLAGNEMYAASIAKYEIVNQINYPMSISEIFLKKNLNSNFEKSLKIIDSIINICEKTKKEPIITLTLAFGNPYGDDWNIDILIKWIEILKSKSLKFIPLADTLATASSEIINKVFRTVIEEFKDLEFNFHLHTKPSEAIDKVEAAYTGACRSFDTVFAGLGGCPMSGKELTGNLDTNTFTSWLFENNIENDIDRTKLYDSLLIANNIFHKTI